MMKSADTGSQSSLPVLTPAHFPLAGLNQGELGLLLEDVDPEMVEDIYMLSPLQNGILFDLLNRPGSGDYLVQTAYEVNSVIDQEALVAAWRHVISRHDVLRSTLAIEGVRQPVQIVYRDFPIDLRRWDWSGRASTTVEDALGRLMLGRRREGIDVTEAPPLAFDLIRLADDRHLLVWHQHHILLDAWSGSLILSEFLRAYDALVACVPPSLPEPVQFSQHLDWLARNLDHPEDQQFWEGLVGDLSSPTRLPFIDGGIGYESADSLTAVARLDPDTTNALQQVARGSHCTLHTVLQGAWGLLLSRLSGSENVCWGTVLSGRSTDEPGVEDMIGLLVNTVPVRISVESRANASEWLTRLQGLITQIRRHEHTGLADIRRAADLAPGTPMFDTLFQFAADISYQVPPSHGIALTVVKTYEQAGFPIDLTVAHRDGGLVMQVTYTPARVGRLDAERVLASYEQILHRMIATPECSVEELTAPGPDELRVMLDEWSGVGSSAGVAGTVHGLFGLAAAQRSDAVALVGVGESLSYAEVDAASTRLARLLRLAGVGPDVVVGVALPRSAEMVVALLGVLKAGGAYLALDASAPRERNEFFVSDSQALVVLATRQTLEGLGSAVDRQTVLVMDDELTLRRWEEASPEPLSEVALADCLAYISYTSGSTGTPKCVGITHRNIVRLAYRPSYIDAGTDETFIHLAPLGFDASIEEIWVALLNGGRLVLPAPGQLDIPDIARIINDNGVTTASLTTGLFHQYVAQDLSSLCRLRRLVIGGDVALADACRSLVVAAPELVLVNSYGPTENTGVTAAVRIEGAVGARVPIGRPIAGTSVYVLDEWFRPVPIGVVGQLCTGGAGVSRGYLNDAAATADKYVPDPFSTMPGSRMYCTGDAVRWCPDGLLDFVGRSDGQVKIRGFRIEVGEVEARLVGHPDVSEVAVVARADRDGHKRLVAYVVPCAEARLTASEIRAFAGQSLPEYMVPTVVVFLEQIPLTANGKIDRTALPEPAEAAVAAVSGQVAPRNATETVLTEAWKQVLDLPSVGVEDNFFDLGGDSILSIRIASRARQAGLSVSSSDLFDHQTIAELASAVGDGRASVKAEQGAVTGDVPLTPIQRWFLDTAGPLNHFNQSVRLEGNGILESDLLQDALAAVLRQHDAMRLRLTRDGDAWRQYLAPSEDADVLTVVDLTEVAELEREQKMTAAAQQAQTSLDLFNGPLLRAVHYITGTDNDQLLLVAHHMSVDTVSWDFILDDLNTVYGQLTAGRRARLPAKGTSYQTWAEDLMHRIETPDFEKDLSPWLGTAPDRGEVWSPVDPAPDLAGAAGHVWGYLDRSMTEQLFRRTRQLPGVDVRAALLVALGRTLQDWTGADFHQIDLEGHGRDALHGRDVSNTVGWFTALFPIRLSLRSEGEAVEHLNTVQRLLGNNLNGSAFGMARYLRADERFSAWPLSPICFNYHGQLRTRSTGDFRRLSAENGSEIDPTAPRAHAYDMTVLVIDGSMHIRLSYPGLRHCHREMADLVARLTEQVAVLASRHDGSL